MNFKNLKVLKGITCDDFDPLELFQGAGRKIPTLSWSIPDNPALKQKVLGFLEFN